LEFPELDRRIVVPPRALKVRGHVRTRHLKAVKRAVWVRSVLPMSAGRASQLAGTHKCKKKDKDGRKCLDAKPSSSSSPSPSAPAVFLSEEERVLDREHEQLHDGVDLEEEAALDEQSDQEEQEEQEQEQDQEDLQDEESMLEVGAARKRHHKKHKKDKKKKKPRVPKLVSQPSGLVRRELHAGHMGARRSYARRVDAVSSHIHVITPHRRKKDGRKRKIQLAALLDVKGNVVFGAKDHKKKHKKNKHHNNNNNNNNNPPSSTSPQPTQPVPASSSTSSAPALIEEMMVLSQHSSSPDSSQPLPAALVEHGDLSSVQSRYQHQWRLIYDDVNHGWHAALQAATLPQCTLGGSSSSSSVPFVRPAQAFGAAHPSVTSTAMGAPMTSQTFADLPEHSLLQISATFHFMGSWSGQIGYAMIDGQHVWLDSFDSSSSSSSSSLLAQQSMSLRVVVPHRDDRVTISFGSSLTADAAGSACWGFDDVAISVSH